jgi:hypothetical protein
MCGGGGRVKGMKVESLVEVDNMSIVEELVEVDQCCNIFS